LSHDHEQFISDHVPTGDSGGSVGGVGGGGGTFKKCATFGAASIIELAPGREIA